MSVRDLIDAIYVGDSESIETAFNHEMAERISTRLDAMRVEVAKNMFNEQVEELDELEEELDEEQLDELSKTTLGSYAHKAVNKAQDHAHDAHDSYRLSDDKEQAQHVHKMTKRLQGIDRAGKSLGDKTIGKSAEKSVDYHLKQRRDSDNWDWAEAGKHHRAALRNSGSAHNKITKASGVKENYELDEEQLDELSKDTLKSYVDKAATRLVSGDKYKGMDRYNRVDGIKKATSKLVKQEETE